MKKEYTYFEKRMASLGLKPGEEFVELPDPNADASKSVKLFSENEFGDILIHYYQLSGAPYSYRKEGNKWSEPYTRRRLKSPIGDMKYSSPKGQGLNPWFSPEVIWKHKKGEKIKQLNLIEGEFKAFAASGIGIDAVGMGSIHGFYAKKYSDSADHVLHPDLATLIKDCNVESVCLCLDADAKAVKWRHDKDLWKRQNSFRKAAANFFKVVQFYIDSDDYALKSVHLVHLKRKFIDQNAKGLDDLIAKKPKEKHRILTDLLAKKQGKEEAFYFDFLELDVNYWTQLESYFGLESVEAFYRTYKADIGKKQFVYKNARFVVLEDDKPKFLFHKDVENFFRIGTDWMKKIRVPNKFGDVDEKVIPFSISEINRDYPQKAFPGFVERIQKFDAYCNEPDWSGNYKREHYGCYNLANPIAHNPVKGSCPITLKFVKHIFSGEGDVREYYDKDGPGAKLIWRIECVHPGDQFTVGLDWLSIFHRYPKQMLPVPILVSKEFGTGKSTFFKWLKSIYGSNTAILNNEQFKMKFNAHYITKGLIIIDEGFLDVDKKAEKERLKQLVTSDTNYVEHKGVNLQEFPYYGKVMMGSNDAENVMRMESDENRWFVVKVNPFTGKENPDLEMQLKQEIPAWLDFIASRTIAHPREQRLWFKEDYFITEQFKLIVKATKTRIEKNIDDLIKDLFLTFKVSALRLSRKWIVERLNEQSKYKTDQQEVKRYLDDKLHMRLNAPASINHPLRFDQDLVNSNQYKIVWSDKKVERYYEFKVDDWIQEEDLEDDKGMDSFNASSGQNSAPKNAPLFDEIDTPDQVPF